MCKQVWELFAASPAHLLNPVLLPAVGEWAPGNVTVMSLTFRGTPMCFGRDARGRMSHAFDVDLLGRLP